MGRKWDASVQDSFLPLSSNLNFQHPQQDPDFISPSQDSSNPSIKEEEEKERILTRQSSGRDLLPSESDEGSGLDQLIDLSNIQNISDLNQLGTLKQRFISNENSILDQRERIPDSDQTSDGLDIDQIELELAQENLRKNQRLQMQKLSNNKSQTKIKNLKIEEIMVDSPQSNHKPTNSILRELTEQQELPIFDNIKQPYLEKSQKNQRTNFVDEKRRQGMEQQKLTHQSQQQQLQRELRELLSQSHRDDNIGSDLDDAGFSARQIEELMALANDNDCVPHDISDEELEESKLERVDFKRNLVGDNLSPPLVASHHSSQQSNYSENQLRPEKKHLKGFDKFESQKQAFQNPPVQSPKESLIAGEFKKDSNQVFKVDSGRKEGEDKSEGEENDSFHKLYNKEIKVNQDEIPLLLLELTDIAFKFIKKDQYEKAYVLLQKTESVLEVVNLEHSKRDRYFAFITFLNMAMCFQKLGMLDECIIYIRESLKVLEKPQFFKDVSIALRVRQMQMKCQLRLQLCAILSQTQKHLEAMESAKIAVSLIHQVLADVYNLCQYYANKIKFKEEFASLSLLLLDETEEDSKKKSQSEINQRLLHRQINQQKSPVKDIPFNILEESISMVERTALKLLPILKELGNRLAGTKGKGLNAFELASGKGADSAIQQEMESRSDNNAVLSTAIRKKKSKDKGMLMEQEEEEEKEMEGVDKQEEGQKVVDERIDMRTVLGFLNQSEWIMNMNIGNIMQIQPVRMRDFLQSSRNETALSRESFLEKIQLLIVAYFCVSTEQRFIIQSRNGFMKQETQREKELEQEYWHVRALNIACAFLPSECPLFNHILLNYQKHHDPAQHAIMEDEVQEDEVSVLKPLRGIENPKYQPIVRDLKDVKVEIASLTLSPLNSCYDQRILPKIIKTTSMDIQTDPVKPPTPVTVRSQSISVQNDLQFSEQKEEPAFKKIPIQPYQDLEDSPMTRASKNSQPEPNAQKYQDNLIVRIVNDPNIQDKQLFLGKLIKHLNKQGKNTIASVYGTKLANCNTQSSQLVSYNQPRTDQVRCGTLNTEPNDPMDGVYGQRRQKRGQMAKNGKNTKSGVINSRGKSSMNNLEPDSKSFDHKSHQVLLDNSTSFYGETSSIDGAFGRGQNHNHSQQNIGHIQSMMSDSRSFQPYQNKMTDQKDRKLFTSKKNQSVAYLNQGHGAHTIDNESSMGILKNKHPNSSMSKLSNQSRQQMGGKKRVKEGDQKQCKLLAGISGNQKVINNIRVDSRQSESDHKQSRQVVSSQPSKNSIRNKVQTRVSQVKTFATNNSGVMVQQRMNESSGMILSRSSSEIKKKQNNVLSSDTDQPAEIIKVSPQKFLRSQEMQDNSDIDPSQYNNSNQTKTNKSLDNKCRSVLMNKSCQKREASADRVKILAGHQDRKRRDSPQQVIDSELNYQAQSQYSTQGFQISQQPVSMFDKSNIHGQSKFSSQQSFGNLVNQSQGQVKQNKILGSLSKSKTKLKKQSVIGNKGKELTLEKKISNRQSICPDNIKLSEKQIQQLQFHNLNQSQNILRKLQHLLKRKESIETQKRCTSAEQTKNPVKKKPKTKKGEEEQVDRKLRVSRLTQNGRSKSRKSRSKSSKSAEQRQGKSCSNERSNNKNSSTIEDRALQLSQKQIKPQRLAKQGTAGELVRQKSQLLGSQLSYLSQGSTVLGTAVPQQLSSEDRQQSLENLQKRFLENQRILMEKNNPLRSQYPQSYIPQNDSSFVNYQSQFVPHPQSQEFEVDFSQSQPQVIFQKHSLNDSQYTSQMQPQQLGHPQYVNFSQTHNSEIKSSQKGKSQKSKKQTRKRCNINQILQQNHLFNNVLRNQSGVSHIQFEPSSHGEGTTSTSVINPNLIMNSSLIAGVASTTASTNNAMQFLSGKSQKSRKNKQRNISMHANFLQNQNYNSASDQKHIPEFDSCHIQQARHSFEVGCESNQAPNQIMKFPGNMRMQPQHVHHLQESQNIKHLDQLFNSSAPDINLLIRPNSSQNFGFPAHVNIMPKTTGSQAYLLKKQMVNSQKSKSQTGRSVQRDNRVQSGSRLSQGYKIKQ